MFLNLRAHARDESGSTLIAVVGLVAVAALITTVVTVSTVQALGYTTSTRAGVQAQAAADAGVAYLTDRLKQDSCAPTADRNYGQIYTSAVLAAEAAALGETSLTLADLGVAASDPYFSAKVQYKVPLAGAWTDGCPPRTLVGSLFTYQVRVESTGYAANEGVNGVSALDEHTVEAVYGWSILTLETPAAPQILASGAAVYAYNSGGFGQGGQYYGVDGAQPDAKIKTGDVTCSGDFSGMQNIVVEGGKFDALGSCKVSGSVWARDRVYVTGGGAIAGNVVAGSVTAESGGTIGGSVWSSGSALVKGNARINGVLKAKSLTLDSGHLPSGGYIYGATNVTGAGGSTLGADLVTQTATGVPDWWSYKSKVVLRNPIGTPTLDAGKPTTTAAPDWVDFSYDKDDWTGFTEVVLSGLTCENVALQAKIDSVSGPVVVNALGCLNGVKVDPGGLNPSLHKVSLNKDVAIIANKFQLLSSAGFSGTQSSRLWLITPDPPGLLTTGTPTCQLGQSFVVSGEFSFSDKIATLIYTPCSVTVGTGVVTFRGQLFVGKAAIGGGAKLGYVKVGLPGVDLDTGGSGGGGGIVLPPVLTGIGGSLGALDYYRDVP